VTFLEALPADAAQLTDQSARAEALARQAVGDWSAWLERQLVA
jgi:hypothetical protein